MTASRLLFRKYPNRVFVETGAQTGNGINQALQSGFREIYSIELDEECIQYCRDRFKENLNVHLIYGDSRYILGSVLQDINEPITFWLDGHNEDDYPIMQELQIIGRHNIKTHSILIDDLRMFNFIRHGFNLDMIKKAILEINSNYIFSFERGHIANDILAATVRK